MLSTLRIISIILCAFESYLITVIKINDTQSLRKTVYDNPLRWRLFERLDIHFYSEAFKNYIEILKIWSIVRKDVKDDNVPKFIGKDVYWLFNNLAFTDNAVPTSMKPSRKYY